MHSPNSPLTSLSRYKASLLSLEKQTGHLYTTSRQYPQDVHLHLVSLPPANYRPLQPNQMDRFLSQTLSNPWLTPVSAV